VEIEGRPMMSRMATLAAPGRREWFHQEPAAHEMAMAGPPPGGRMEDPDDPLKELTWLAFQLPAEDLAPLATLARRLHRGR
jgi:hypothetical protein